jgi:hypothetical protein
MTPIPLQPNIPMPTDYSGDPVPPKQYYRCPHCKEQSPLTKEWVGLTDVEIDYLLVSTVGENEETHISFARAIEFKLKERNT